MVVLANTDGLEDELKQLRFDHDRKMLRLKYQREELESARELRMMQESFDAEQAEEIGQQAQEVKAPVSIDWASLRNLTYEENRGFCISWQYVQGISGVAGQSMAISFALFDGSDSYQSAVAVPQKPLEVANQGGLQQCFINSTHRFNCVPSQSSMRFIIDCRIAEKSGLMKNIPVGWTFFELFDHQSTLRAGDWKLRLHHHPVDFDPPAVFLAKETAARMPVTVYFSVCDAFHESMVNRPLHSFPDHFLKHISPFVPSDQSAKEEIKKQAPASKTIGSIWNRGSDKKAEQDAPSKKRGILKGRRNDSHLDETAIPNAVDTAINGVSDTPAVSNFPVIDDEIELSKAANFGSLQSLVPTDPSLGEVFPLGVQFNDITDIEYETPVFVRLSKIDSNGLNAQELFQSAPTELGVNENHQGWEFGSFHELKTLQGKFGQTGLLELVSTIQAEFGIATRVIANAKIELFKFHNQEAFGINDGSHSVQFTFDSVKVCTLHCRFYKPRHEIGPPPIIKVFYPSKFSLSRG